MWRLAGFFFFKYRKVFRAKKQNRKGSEETALSLASFLFMSLVFYSHVHCRWCRFKKKKKKRLKWNWRENDLVQQEIFLHPVSGFDQINTHGTPECFFERYSDHLSRIGMHNFSMWEPLWRYPGSVQCFEETRPGQDHLLTWFSFLN